MTTSDRRSAAKPTGDFVIVRYRLIEPFERGMMSHALFRVPSERWAALVVLPFAIALAAPGCRAPEVATRQNGSWVGSITAEDGITTVINESGSVWGGTARVIEEMSIGVDVGADEYMFGSISGVWATEDRIFVADSQVPAVRIYDFDGNFIANLGGAGQGPGEYSAPGPLTGTADGRLYVLDDHNNKIHVYTVGGEFLDTWPARDVAFWPTAVADDGTLWLPLTVVDGPGREEFRRAIQAHGPEGAFGPRYMLRDIDFTPVTVSIGGRDREIVPFAPRQHWAPVGPAAFVVGASDRYRFEIQREGRTAIVVEKHWDPIPVGSDYIEWARQVTVAQYRGSEPGWSWNGAEIPDHLPPYSGLYPMADGRIWATRRGRSERRSDCVDTPLAAGASAARANPCWVVQWAPPDVFGSDGRYLGSVEIPPEVGLSYSSFFARGDVVIDAVLDEAGTPIVKRYRLVLPGSS